MAAMTKKENGNKGDPPPERRSRNVADLSQAGEAHPPPFKKTVSLFHALACCPFKVASSHGSNGGQKKAMTPKNGWRSRSREPKPSFLLCSRHIPRTATTKMGARQAAKKHRRHRSEK